MYEQKSITGPSFKVIVSTNKVKKLFILFSFWKNPSCWIDFSRAERVGSQRARSVFVVFSVSVLVIMRECQTASRLQVLGGAGGGAGSGSWEKGRGSQQGVASTLATPFPWHKRRCLSSRSVLEKFWGRKKQKCVFLCIVFHFHWSSVRKISVIHFVTWCWAPLKSLIIISSNNSVRNVLMSFSNIQKSEPCYYLVLLAVLRVCAVLTVVWLYCWRIITIMTMY